MDEKPAQQCSFCRKPKRPMAEGAGPQGIGGVFICRKCAEHAAAVIGDVETARGNPRKPFQFGLTISLSAIAGSAAGAFLAFCAACSKLMGDAEVYPPDNIPPAPDVIKWIVVGGGVGLLAGLAFGAGALGAAATLRFDSKRPE